MTPFRIILHPSDFSPASARARAKAVELARQNGARLVVAHVLHPVVPAATEGFLSPGTYAAIAEAGRRDAQRRLDVMVARARTGGVRAESLLLDEDTNLDDEEEPLVGRAIPVSVALLGLAFVASALLVTGLPPLSGFVATVALLSSVLGANGTPTAAAGGWIAGLVLLAGLLATISLSRVGIRLFWSRSGQDLPRVKLIEALPVIALLVSGMVLALGAEPVLRYTAATAEGLHAPRPYIEAVMATKARPGPARTGIDGSAR